MCFSLCAHAVLYLKAFICECGWVRVCVCVCMRNNKYAGAEKERLWLESHYDAVQTVKFMGWILLKADGVIKPPGSCQTPGWAPWTCWSPQHWQENNTYANRGIKWWGEKWGPWPQQSSAGFLLVISGLAETWEAHCCLTSNVCQCALRLHSGCQKSVR